MKHFLALLVAAVACARADVVIEQKMESAFMNGNITMKVKGDQARMDMPGGPAGAITIIVDSKGGTVDTYMHQQKMALKRTASDIKKQAEAAQKLTGIDPSKMEKPKATGQKEKVGDWEAEIHEFDAGSGKKGKVWVVKDFPNYKAISEQMSKMSAAMGSGGVDPSKFDLGGMIVKTEMETGTGKMTVTILKVKEEAVAETEFKAPEGYKEMKLPGFGG